MTKTSKKDVPVKNWLDNVANGGQYVTKAIKTYIDKDLVSLCR